jgi:hypothetical protein
MVSVFKTPAAPPYHNSTISTPHGNSSTVPPENCQNWPKYILLPPLFQIINYTLLSKYDIINASEMYDLNRRKADDFFWIDIF